MVTQIDITAGNILEFLDENDGVELSRLFSSLADSRDLVLMSLGWLIRKGCVVLKKEGLDYRVYFKKNSDLKIKTTRCPDFREGKYARCLASGGNLMTPSIYEMDNFCFSFQYENCPLRKRQESNKNIF